MAATDFVDLSTVVPAAWLDHVDRHVYDGKNPSFVTSTGSANAQTVTLPSSTMGASGLAVGQVISFKAGYTNTGATTLEVIGAASTTAIAVQMNGAALAGGEIVVNSGITVVYLNSVWNIIENTVQRAKDTKFTAAGGIVATDVQAAIEELDTEKTNTADLFQWTCIDVSDETTVITTGTAKRTFRLPACTVLAVRASLTTSSSSGLPTVDINEAGTSILGANKLSIDANELTSTTAATPTTIADATIAEDAQMTIDIDVAGTGATGLKVYLKVRWT